MLMGIRGILFEKSPSSSSALGNEPSGDPFTALIQYLKVKIIDVDLF